MHVKYAKALTAWAVCWFIFGSLAFGKQPDSLVLYRSAFDAADQQADPCAELLEHIRDSHVVFGSDVQPRGGFERVAIWRDKQNPNATRGFRSPVRWEDGRAGILHQHWVGSYQGYLADGHGFVRLPQTKWFSTEGSWRLSVDGRPNDTEVSWSDLPHAVSGRGRFDLASKLELLGDNAIPDCEWDKPTSTLSIRREDGSRFFLRFRTPNDSLVFGTDLSELRWHAPAAEKSVVWTRWEVSASLLDKTFTLVPHDSIRKHLGAEHFERQEDFSYAEMQDVALLHSERSDLLASILGLSHVPELKKDVTDHRSYFGTLDDRSRLAFLLQHPNDVFDLTDSSEIGQFYESLNEMLEWIADERYRKRGAPLQVDDPSMLWRDAERITSALEMWKIVEYSRQFCSKPLLSDQDRIRLLARVAELGPPPFAGAASTFEEREFEDPFVEALFRVRWQWITEAKHVDALTNAIRTYAVGTPHSLLATDSLLRLGRNDLVPQEELDSWWSFYILRAHNKASRMRALSTLSRHESGLRYMVFRMGGNLDDASLRVEMATIINDRVEAVRALRRYDYISQELCKDIEQISSSF